MLFLDLFAWSDHVTSSHDLNETEFNRQLNELSTNEPSNYYLARPAAIDTDSKMTPYVAHGELVAFDKLLQSSHYRVYWSEPRPCLGQIGGFRLK